MQQTEITFGGHSTAIPSVIIDTLKGQFTDRVRVETDGIVINGKIMSKIMSSQMGMDMLREFLLSGRQMEEYTERSHYDTLTFLYTATALGFKPEQLQNYCIHPSKDEKWANRKGIEVLPYIGRILPQMFNPRLYFLKSTHPFSIVQTAYNEYKSRGHRDIKRLVRQLTWLQKFDLASLFNEVSAKTIQRLGELKKMRADAFDNVIIDVVNGIESEFVRVTPDRMPEITVDAYPHIYMEEVRVPIGKNVICDRMGMLRNFEHFTCGVFNKMRLSSFRGIIVAGNSARQCMMFNYAPRASSDCDIFVYGKTPQERKETVIQLLKAFEQSYRDKIYFGVVGSVISVYICGIPRAFQIVCGWFRSAYDVINRFDVSHIQCGFDMNGGSYNPIMTVQCARSLMNYVTEVWNTDQLRTERMVKAIYSGYSIESSEHFVAMNIDLKGSLESARLCAEAIEQFCSYYHLPNTMPASREEIANVIRHIKQQSKSVEVFTLAGDAIKMLKFDGEFNSVYSTKLWSEFDINKIGVIVPLRRGTKIIKSIGTANRFRSGILKVTGWTISDDDFTLRCMSTEQPFSDHLAALRMSLAGHVRFGARNGQFTTGFDVAGVIKLTIPIERINTMKNYGSGLIIDSKGQALDIDSAFREGDEVYTVYSYGIYRDYVNGNTETRPVIVPFKIVRVRTDEEDDTEDANSEAPIVPPTASSKQALEYDD